MIIFYRNRFIFLILLFLIFLVIFWNRLIFILLHSLIFLRLLSLIIFYRNWLRLILKFLLFLIFLGILIFIIFNKNRLRLILPFLLFLIFIGKLILIIFYRRFIFIILHFLIFLGILILIIFYWIRLINYILTFRDVSHCYQFSKFSITILTLHVIIIITFRRRRNIPILFYFINNLLNINSLCFLGLDISHILHTLNKFLVLCLPFTFWFRVQFIVSFMHFLFISNFLLRFHCSFRHLLTFTHILMFF